MGIARIKVGWEGHRLGVKVKADKETYSVRETVKASIEVKTPNGKAPKNADVAFAAVDEALLQLAPNESWQVRSEEHTSELQSLMRISYAVFCLKTKINKNKIHNNLQ